jgi:hypothetical protein
MSAHWLVLLPGKVEPTVTGSAETAADARGRGWEVEGPFVPAAQLTGAVGDLRAALNELGVPGPDYPAPVANAVEHIKAALAHLGGQS